MKDCRNLAIHLRHERIKRGLTQLQVAQALVEQFGLAVTAAAVMRSVVSAESETRRYVRTPPTVHRLAAWYGWPAGAVERALDGQEPLAGVAAAMEPMSAKVKEDWRRRMLASEQLSAEAKRQNLAFLESIPERS